MATMKSIVETVSAQTGVKPGDCAKVIAAAFAEVRNELADQDTMSVPQLGGFRKSPGDGEEMRYVFKLKTVA